MKRIMFAVIAVMAAQAFGISHGHASDGMIVKPSDASMQRTLERLTTAIESRGAKVALTVDHAAAAKANGLELRPTTLVLFGNPKLGTPLMQQVQATGLDLPLRVLVWQDGDGKVHLGYWAPPAVGAMHGLPADNPVLAKMAGALDGIVREAAGS